MTDAPKPTPPRKPATPARKRHEPRPLYQKVGDAPALRELRNQMRREGR